MNCDLSSPSYGPADIRSRTELLEIEIERTAVRRVHRGAGFFGDINISAWMNGRIGADFEDALFHLFVPRFVASLRVLTCLSVVCKYWNV